MRQQYLDLKRQYPDAILLFRLGDFYETFDNDAIVVSQVCEITLTSRPVGKDVRVPLAGVPYHAADTYIAKLVKAGHRIAVAEQSDSGDRSLMQRQVVRVITPGTVTEDFLLRARSNNYLAALATTEEAAALAYADVSTGEFVAEEYRGRDRAALTDALERLKPAECVVADGDADAAAVVGAVGAPLARVEGWRVTPERAREALLHHFDVQSLAPFGIEGSREASVAAALCLLYLQQTRPEAAASLESLRLDTGDRYLYVDQTVQRNLELVECTRGGDAATLLAVLDLTQTPMGARLLRRRLLKPLREPAAIAFRLDGLQSLFAADALRSRLRDGLKHVPDLERLSARLAQGTAGPRHLLAILQASLQIRRLCSIAADAGEMRGETEQAIAALDACDEAATLIAAAIAD
ncbi:MAG: MutS N-terminal domain-containing protein, partial [Anaerolineae bacterium]